jgi:hypothetical protein
MQQRRPRLGDILDDYCPRERRITNHAVVAMIEDTVKQTRCTTCDADHEYREGKLPSPRRRKPGTADGVLVPRSQPVLASTAGADIDPGDDSAPAPILHDDEEPVMLSAAAEEHVEADGDADVEEEPEAVDRDEWPVHRPLIRATLPRPEGQVPERKAPDFTVRPAGGRFDANRNGQRKGGHRPMRQAQGQPGQSRAGGQRTGPGQGQGGPRQAAGQGQGQRQGNRPGGASRPGQSRGPRPGGGRKRGR